MKRKLIGLILITSLMLVGCGEELDTKSQSEEASEMVLEAYDYMATLSDNLALITNYLNRIVEYPDLVEDSYFKDSFMGTINEYHAYLSAIDAPPTTEFDFEIDEPFSQVIENMILGLESLKLFVETGHVGFLSLYGDYIDKATASQKEMNLVLQNE